MSQNIEIKALAGDFVLLKAKLASLQARHVETLQQHDTFYRMPFGKFKLRRFDGGNSELIVYFRRDSFGPKQSKYFRFTLARGIHRALQPIGRLWPKVGDVRKTRELFMYGETRIHLDRVEGLGKYVEFEVVLRSDDKSALKCGMQTAEYLMSNLGIEDSDLVSKAYIDLLPRSNRFQDSVVQ